MSNGNGHRWSKFWWRDWSGEMALRMCSLAARGFWMELLCVMHEGTPTGYLTINGRAATHRQMASWAGCSEREAKRYEAELEAAQVFSRTEAGVIYCRRMAREAEAEAEARETWRAYGETGGNPKIARGTVPKQDRQRPYRRSDSPQKTERIFQRDGGCCHWCKVPLDRDNPRHPHFFHVDHIVAVRDGGGVDEHNLVASCQRCNMERARQADHNDNGHSDTNPPDIPTATLGKIPTATHSKKLEAEAESERDNLSLSSLYSRPRGGNEIPWRSPAFQMVYEEGLARKAAEMAEDDRKRAAKGEPLSEVLARLGHVTH